LVFGNGGVTSVAHIAVLFLACFETSLQEIKADEPIPDRPNARIPFDFERRDLARIGPIEIYTVFMNKDALHHAY
jgi:hypothetical protein